MWRNAATICFGVHLELPPVDTASNTGVTIALLGFFRAGVSFVAADDDDDLRFFDFFGGMLICVSDLYFPSWVSSALDSS